MEEFKKLLINHLYINTQETVSLYYNEILSRSGLQKINDKYIENHLDEFDVEVSMDELLDAYYKFRKTDSFPNYDGEKDDEEFLNEFYNACAIEFEEFEEEYEVEEDDSYDDSDLVQQREQIKLQTPSSEKLLEAYKKLYVKIDPHITAFDVSNPLKLTAEKWINNLESALAKKTANVKAKGDHTKEYTYDVRSHEDFVKIVSQSGLIPVSIVDMKPLEEQYIERNFKTYYLKFNQDLIIKYFGTYKPVQELIDLAKTDSLVRKKLGYIYYNYRYGKLKPGSKVKKPYIPVAFTADTFIHDKITFHTPETLVDFMFENDNYLHHDFAEVCIIDQSRMFFDIDFGLKVSGMPNFSIFEKDLEIINDIIEILRERTKCDIKLHGRFDVKEVLNKGLENELDNFKYVSEIIKRCVGKQFDNLILIPRGNEFDKVVSGHLFITGIYFTRAELIKLKDILMPLDKAHKTYIDPSVYKELQQMFRHSLSGKLIAGKFPVKVPFSKKYYEHTVYPKVTDKPAPKGIVQKIVNDLAVKHTIVMEDTKKRTITVVHNPITIDQSNAKKFNIFSEANFDFSVEPLLKELDVQFGSEDNRAFGYALYRRKKLSIINTLLQLGSYDDDEIINMLNDHPRIKSDGSLESADITNDANVRDLHFMKANYVPRLNKNALEIIRTSADPKPLDLYCINSMKEAVMFSDMIMYLQTSVVLIGSEYHAYLLSKDDKLELKVFPRQEFRNQNQFFVTFFIPSDDNSAVTLYRLHVYDILRHYSNLFRPYSSASLYNPGCMTVYSKYRYPIRSLDSVPVKLDHRIMRLMKNMLDSNLIDETELNHRINFVLDCLAFKLQKPGIRFNFAIIICGRQGTGKTTFFAMFEEIIPGFANARLDFNNVMAEFNTDDQDLMIAVYNEVDNVDKKRGRIKALIDDEYRVYNQKHVAHYKCENLSLKFFVSNEMDIKVAKEGDRRFITFKSDKPKDDKSFYESLYDPSDAKKFDPNLIQNFSTFLLQRDIRNFKTTEIPKHLQDDTKEINLTKEFICMCTKETINTDEMGDQIIVPPLTYKYTNKFNEELDLIPCNVFLALCQTFKGKMEITRYTDLYEFWVNNELDGLTWNLKTVNARLGDGDGTIRTASVEVTDDIKKYYEEFATFRTKKIQCFVITGLNPKTTQK